MPDTYPNRSPGYSTTGVRVAAGRLVAALVALLLSSPWIAGCATIVEGSAQTIHVETDPPGARCVITRSGVAVSTIPSTPATISLFKEKGDLALECSKAGYLSVNSAQAPEFSGTVFGNILFGGLIGAAIDMGSGATHKYPDTIFVTLIPERFDSIEGRDTFFDALRERVERRHTRAVEKQNRQCEQREEDCTAALEALEQAHASRLQTLDEQRRDAVIAPTD